MRWGLAVVGNSQSAAQVQVTDCNIQPLQLCDQLFEFSKSIHERARLRQLTADMAGNTHHIKAIQRDCFLILPQRLLNPNTEFVLLETRGNIGVGLGVNIRVDPDGNTRFFSGI